MERTQHEAQNRASPAPSDSLSPRVSVFPDFPAENRLSSMTTYILASVIERANANNYISVNNVAEEGPEAESWSFLFNMGLIQIVGNKIVPTDLGRRTATRETVVLYPMVPTATGGDYLTVMQNMSPAAKKAFVRALRSQFFSDLDASSARYLMSVIPGSLKSKLPLQEMGRQLNTWATLMAMKSEQVPPGASVQACLDTFGQISSMLIQSITRCLQDYPTPSVNTAIGTVILQDSVAVLQKETVYGIETVPISDLSVSELELIASYFNA